MARGETKDLDYVAELFTSASENSDMNVIRGEWDRSDRLVEGWRKRSVPGKANFWIPRTFSTLRAELSTITLSMFSQEQEPPFLYHPPDTLPSMLTPEEAVFEADMDTAIAGNQMRAMRAFLIFRNWFDDTLRYGTGVLKVGWRRHTTAEFEEVPVNDPVTGMPILDEQDLPLTIPQEKTVVLRNGPVIENVDIRNFFVDPNFDTVEDMDFVIQRKEVSLEYIEQMGKAGIYKNTAKVLAAKTGDGHKANVDRYSQVLRAYRGMHGHKITVDTNSPGFKKHAKAVILECQRDDMFYTIAMSPVRVLLRKFKNPFEHGQKTYIALHNIRRPKLFWGKSEPMLVESLQDEENFITNTACDTMTMALHKMFVADRNADIDLDRLKSRQGNIILSNDVDAVRQLEVSEVGLTGYTIISGALSGAFEDATSVTRTFKGATPQRAETATTTASLLSQASQAIKFKWTEFFHEGVSPFATMLRSMNRQFIEPEQLVKVNNLFGEEQFQAYSGKKIDVDFPVYPAASIEDVTGNRELRQANILRFLQVGFGNPALAPFLKPYGMLVESAKAFGFRNPRTLIMSPEEIIQAQQQQAETGQAPAGTVDPQLVQGGGDQQDFGAGQRPQNAPQPENAEDLVRSQSTQGTQAPV